MYPIQGRNFARPLFFNQYMVYKINQMSNPLKYLNMEERKLTEKESLELITSMIEQTRKRYIGDGNILLMWGYLIVCVAAVIWALLVATHNPVWNWLWFVIWVVGGTATPIMAKKEQRRKGVKNYSDTLTSRIWSTVGYSAIASTFLCLGFLLVKGVDAWAMMFALALVIVPFAEISQGIVIKEKSLVAGGAIGLLVGLFTLGCITGGVALYASWFMPLFIIAFVAMMIVPGHILNRKARQEK